MIDPKHPSEIAREALRRLASRHLAPTPANYQACYNEIAKLPNVAPFPEPPLRQIAGALTARGDAQIKQLASLDAAIGRRSWQGVQEALVAFVAAAGVNGRDSGRDSGRESARETERDGGEGQSAPPTLAPALLPPELAARLARFVECLLPALGQENERVLAMFGEFLLVLRQPAVDVPTVEGALASLGHQALFAAEEQVEIKDSLLKLLQLIIENIGELSLDDSWLKGQVDGLLAVVAPPLTLRHLDEMERRLRDVMVKQSEAKNRSVEAQEEMRQMLAAFIERLAMMNESSSVFQGKIEESARQIETISRVEDLAPLLGEVIAASRNMVDETASSREQLTALQERVRSTEAELVQLHLELDNASALARHDPLTDALNRKGLAEALAREIANVRRKDVPLSLCMLDIDNFKKLNDRLGHQAGDAALVHLTGVARRCMRPCDTLARYGGEEFVILMPDTPLELGVEVMTRLQRELTRAFFLSGNEKVLITFSAGVAQLAPDETGSEAIKRADQAMYLAKRAGKNRVLGA